MLRTSSIHVFDHFDLYLTPVTLTFNLPKKCFKRHFSSSRATTVPNCFEIHALLYKLWSVQIWTEARMHGHTHINRTQFWTSMSYFPASGLDKNCTSGILNTGCSREVTVRGGSTVQLCHIILKSMHKCRRYGPKIFTLHHLRYWPLAPPWGLSKGMVKQSKSQCSWEGPNQVWSRNLKWIKINFN